MCSETTPSPISSHGRLAPRRSSWSLLALGVVLALGGCGKKGDPLPPLRYIPQAATDLSARQRGAELVLRGPYPRLATNGHKLPGLEAVELYRLSRPLATGAKAPTLDSRDFQANAELMQTLRGADLTTATVGNRIEIRLPLPTSGPEASRQSLTFAVRFLAVGGERSDLSNLAQVIPVTAPPAPTGLSLEPSPEGVMVSWKASAEAGGFHVYRRLAQEKSYGAAIVSSGAGEASAIDKDARFGSRYIYAVTAVAKEDPTIESSFAEEKELDYRDRFAPGAPTGVIALTEPDRIRLSWEANGEGDLAGYHVYRREPGASSAERLTSSPLTATSFVVTGLTPGRTYTFFVVAVDTQGNESPPSAETQAGLR